MKNECNEAKELMALYRQGQLTEEEKQAMNEHLFFCTECMFQMVLSDDRTLSNR